MLIFKGLSNRFDRANDGVDLDQFQWASCYFRNNAGTVLWVVIDDIYPTLILKMQVLG